MTRVLNVRPLLRGYLHAGERSSPRSVAYLVVLLTIAAAVAFYVVVLVYVLPARARNARVTPAGVTEQALVFLRIRSKPRTFLRTRSTVRALVPARCSTGPRERSRVPHKGGVMFSEQNKIAARRLAAAA